MTNHKGDKSPRKSLKRRLIIQVSSMVAIAMLLMTGVVAYLVSLNLSNQMIIHLKSATRSSQVLLEQRIDYLLENTERLTTNPFVINGLVDAEGRQTYLPKLIESFSKGRNVLSFILVDYDGQVLFQTRQDAPAYNQSVEMRSALAKGKLSLYIQQPENNLIIVAPISYYNTTQGAVIISFDLTAISKQYLKHQSFAYHRLLIGDKVINEVNYNAQIEYLSYRTILSKETPFLQKLGINVEIGLPKEAYLAPVKNDIIRLILVSLLFIIAAVLLSTWIGNSIAKPILILHQRIMRMNSSGASQCSPLGSNDELEELALAFDQRTTKLTATQKQLERDITARIKAQKDLEQLRLYLQNIIDSMPSILIAVNDEELVTLWNNQANEISGINAEQAYGKKLTQVMPMLLPQLEHIRQAIKEQQSQHICRQVHLVEGNNHYSDITIYPLVTNAVVGAVIRIDDVTDQVRMEEMMMQTEKMMSVGGLAAGMAHEINNPLGGIMQGLQNIRRRLSPELDVNKKIADSLNLDLNNVNIYMEQRQILHFMNLMTEASQRAADIVANMLQFSRKPDITLMPENINTLIDKTLELAAIDYDIKKKYDFRKIEIIRDYAPSLPLVDCIASEIQQVLLNLLRNATQALQYQHNERTEPARISVATRGDNNSVYIEVKDNGPGIDEELRTRVFEPFFTTRPVGEGTGLGLSVSYFIIHEEHGGQISISSQSGVGTAFTIILPIKSLTKS